MRNDIPYIRCDLNDPIINLEMFINAYKSYSDAYSMEIIIACLRLLGGTI